MACEKQLLLENMTNMEQPVSKLYARRKSLMVALGGLAILATGIATGLSLSMLCGDSLRRGSTGSLSPTTPTSPDNPINSLHLRDSIISTKPHKSFGPIVSTEESAAQRKKNGSKSVERRSSEDMLESAKIRDTLAKRDVWRPSPGLTWTYQLSQLPSDTQLQQASQYDVWDIDLFDVPQSTIDTIHAAGSKVICYFSAGTIEGWRSDASQFKSSSTGNAMGDWEGENWLNTKSRNVRNIMAARLDLAQSKGCDGVDPDNMDPYNHDSGFSLTENDAINYVTYLAQQASQRGLAIGLKNSGDIIDSVIDVVQYSIEESCTTFKECDLYKPFTQAGKPVFHVEYPKGSGTVNTDSISSSAMEPICACMSDSFSPIVKNNNLDTWQQMCP